MWHNHEYLGLIERKICRKLNTNLPNQLMLLDLWTSHNPIEITI